MTARSIDYRLLQYFVAVAEELHFRRAGDRLFVSPSSVSEGVARLEEILGGRLFVRTSRVVRLTPLGSRLLDDVRQPLAGLQRALDDAAKMAGSTHRVLRVGFMGGGLYDLHTAVIEEMRGRLPLVDLEFVEFELGQWARALATGDIDVAIVRDAPLDERFVIGPAFRVDPVVVVMARDHHLASHEILDVDDLAGERLIRYRPTDSPVDSSLSAGGPMTTPSGASIGTAGYARTIREGFLRIASGDCLALAPQLVVDYYRDVALTSVPLVGLITASALVTRVGVQRPDVEILREVLAATASRRPLPPPLTRANRALDDPALRPGQTATVSSTGSGVARS